MSIIKLKEANCKNCHKCIRGCPVKSISFTDEQAQIIDNECILCGHCTLVCPQNAKYIRSDLDRVRDWLARGEKIYVSLAPSYVSVFPDANIKKMSAALLKLGFTHVEETAIGAGHVSAQYAALMREHKMPNIITTACPTVVLLVEKYYPALVKYLAPVLSPMCAHAKMMREVYGKRIKVVFIGPCISKKYEVTDPANEGVVNAVLSFDELHEWFTDEKIDFSEENDDARGMKGVVNRYYPIPGGIIRTIQREDRSEYRAVAADGIDRCMDILQSLRDDGSEGYFLELNACAGGCVGGPCIKSFAKSVLGAREQVSANVKLRANDPAPLTEGLDTAIRRHYFDLSPNEKQPTEEEIRAVLLKIDKPTPESELNCGACGYSTCREKAIAVCQGKADIKMCLPYMRERAESTSNLIIENTPNCIVVVDEDMNILSFNPIAREKFGLVENRCIGRPIEMYFDSPDFDRVRQTGENIISSKNTYPEYGITVEQHIFRIDGHQKNYVVIMQDISSEERRAQQLSEMRSETVEVAQRVIDKQMRVAQEIASLLGETTGETKVALTKLKKTILAETGETRHE